MAPLPCVLPTNRAAVVRSSGSTATTPSTVVTSGGVSNFDTLLAYVMCYLPPEFVVRDGG